MYVSLVSVRVVDFAVFVRVNSVVVELRLRSKFFLELFDIY